MNVYSGQITVTTAGTAVQGPDVPYVAGAAVKAHPDNTDTVWVGNNGSNTVASTSGFPLDPGEGVVLPGNLNQYWFNADAGGEKICWITVLR